MQKNNMGQTEGPVTGQALQSDVTSAAHGMVASDGAIAAQVGADVMKAGGNAVDAAVATAFALAVTYPEAGNIGGGGFAVVRLANGTVATIDFRERAPGRATRDMYLDANGNVTDKSLTGHLASGVPGSVAGLWALHQKFGSKPWSELLQPAIGYARDGFVMDERVSSMIEDDDRLADFPASAALFLPGGKPPVVGSVFRNPDLAAVLTRIAERGRDGFYTGETADLIVREMERGGGLISREDLAQYEPKWRDPIRFTYRGHSVIAMAPASSGGITMAIMANILSGVDLKSMGAQSAERYHYVAEASRRAFADRNFFLGDQDYIKIPFDMLLSADYAARQRASIDPKRASSSRAIRPGLATAESNETTHFSVVDGFGNAVGLTTTINELHGSAVTVTGGGFLLNDEMDDFTAKVGVPNMFGLVQGEGNTIAPGKRMLSAMTPTIVVDPSGRTLLVTGARGGPRIISAAFQIISNVIDHGQGLPEAVLSPRIHHQHLPDSVFYEPKNGPPAAAIDGLRAMGHAVAQRSGYIGAAPTILRAGNGWVGMPDPRSSGAARGY